MLSVSVTSQAPAGLGGGGSMGVHVDHLIHSTQSIPFLNLCLKSTAASVSFIRTLKPRAELHCLFTFFLTSYTSVRSTLQFFGQLFDKRTSRCLLTTYILTHFYDLFTFSVLIHKTMKIWDFIFHVN